MRGFAPTASSREKGSMIKSYLMASACSLGLLGLGCKSSDTAISGEDAAAAPQVKGCAVPDAQAYDPQINPSDFSTTVDNKYFPLPPGTTFSHRDADGNGNDFEVTSEIKVILGVTCVVVHDVAKTSTGEVIEDTFDWYAQHKDGTVWYFGEDTKELQDGVVVSTHGAWEAGKDCAKPGIIMMADPQPGDSYREEYYAGEAEDEATVESITDVVEITYNAQDAATGTYTNCLRTKNFTRLSPDAVEKKWYCAGLGEARAEEVKTVGGKVEQLVSITKQ
jgi:hypothetical protein